MNQTLIPLKHVATITLGKMLQNDASSLQDVELPYVRAASIGQDGKLRYDEAKTMWFKPNEVETLSLLKGDVLVVEGGDVGRSIVLSQDEPGWGFQNSINRVRPFPGNDGRFLQYQIEHLRACGYLRLICNAVSFHHLTAEKLAAVRVRIPTSGQQQRIANYLDIETAKIDHLIAKQQKLLGLTQEQAEANVEAAIWGQSITREKNDRIAEHSYQPRSLLCLAVADRLSAIPKSWDVQRFKRIFSRKDDLNTDSSLEMLSLRQTGAVVPRSETNQNQEPSEKSLPKYLAVSPNDLVVNPMWLTGGAIGVSGLSGAVSPDYRVFTIGTDLTPAYAHEILRSISYRRQFKLFERANTTFDRRIQQIDLDNLPVPIPPVEHQKEIIHMVTQIHSHTQKLYEASERSIKLLQERRSALITAAVTGQIEV